MSSPFHHPFTKSPRGRNASDASLEQTDQLPHWDMTRIYPGLESAEFEEAFADVLAGISSLGDRFETFQRGTDESNANRQVAESSQEQETAFLHTVLSQLNELQEKVTTVNAYIYAFVTTEARNDLAQSRLSELQEGLVGLANLETRLARWVASLDIASLSAQSSMISQHSFTLLNWAEGAGHQMSRGEEELAAALNLPGAEAWSKLHSNVTSLLKVGVAFPDGTTETLPMSKVRALAHHPDEGRRKAAYDAELRGWESVAVPLAAALNGVKGSTAVLNERRSWASSIEPSLFMNNVDMPTLEALQAAVVESLPDFRRYLTTKARLLGKDSLPWWDLYAPMPAEGGPRRWSYTEASDFIRQQFAGYSDRLAGLAARAFEQNWIDAEPRDGKQQGGYCMTVRREESRVMVNFEPSFDALQTLAHELGHAYHHYVVAERTPLQRKTPMALAETASTFCQAIVFNAALKQSAGDERMAMLESSLQDACGYIVDIHGRYLFEKAVFEARRKRELAVSELNELMLDCQRQTYGDGLDNRHLHRYMWAGKVHYYMPDLSFYNWPYTFGMLFSFGLYNRYLQHPASFPAQYDELLSSTGMAGAAELANRFGIDIRSVEFWRSSLDVCRDRIRQFEELSQGT